MPKTISKQADFEKPTKRDKKIFIVLLVGSAIALLASIVLSVDAIELAKNKDAVLSCNINDVLNCAAVGSSDAASLFLGIPNSFIGMTTLPVMITIAVAGLTGVRYPKWFMNAALVGALLGIVSAIWMFYTSFAVLQVLCPWCLTLDASMLLVGYALWRYAALHGTLDLPTNFQKKLREFSEKGFDSLVVFIIAFLAVFAVVLKFGDALFL